MILRAWKHTFCFLELVCLGLVEAECINIFPFIVTLRQPCFSAVGCVHSKPGFASAACALPGCSAPSLRGLSAAPGVSPSPQDWGHWRMCQAHTSAAFSWAELKPFKGELSLILCCELLTPGIWWKLIKVSLWLTVGCLANLTHDYFQRLLLHCRIS